MTPEMYADAEAAQLELLRSIWSEPATGDPVEVDSCALRRAFQARTGGSFLWTQPPPEGSMFLAVHPFGQIEVIRPTNPHSATRVAWYQYALGWDVVRLDAEPAYGPTSYKAREADTMLTRAIWGQP